MNLDREKVEETLTEVCLDAIRCGFSIEQLHKSVDDCYGNALSELTQQFRDYKEAKNRNAPI